MSEQQMTAAPAVPAQTDRELAGARKLGRHAGLNGEPITACPYSVTGGGRDLVLGVNWLRGYRVVNPASVTYEGDQAVTPGE